MPRYKVLTSILDRVDYDAGFHPDGRPKRIIEHKKDDVIEFHPDTPDDRIQELIDRKAIAALQRRPNDQGGDGEQKGGGDPPGQ